MSMNLGLVWISFIPLRPSSHSIAQQLGNGFLCAFIAVCGELCALENIAHAFGPITIKLSNFETEAVECPSGTRAFGGYNNVTCLEVTADSENPTN